MGLISSLFSRPREGTHYEDRMHRILGACYACGLLWHEETLRHRSGAVEVVRTEDVRSTEKVIVTPQYEKYGLHVNPRVLAKLLTIHREMASALNVARVSIEQEGGVVWVRVPLETSQTVTFDEAWAIKPDPPSGTILLGVDDDHQQLAVNLLSPAAYHCAVIGMTGSGKTTLMQTMILSCLRSGAPVALLDPAQGFRALSGYPLVWRGGVFEAPADCAAALGCLVRRMEKRAKLPDLFVFVDEVPDLVRQSPVIRNHLGRIAQSGRHAGLHLILGAQHPLTSELGSATMRNVGIRLVGRVADRTAAYNASGVQESGCETLQGKGDMIAFLGSRRAHFQAAIADLTPLALAYPPRTGRVPPQPSALPPRPVARPTAPAPAPAPGGGHGPGFDDIPPALVEWIRAQTPLPSLRAVGRWGLEHLGAEIRRDKARDAIMLATGGRPDAPRQIAR